MRVKAILMGVPLLLAAPAASQSARPPQPSVDGYICDFTDACAEAAPGAEGEPTMDVDGTKGFRVARRPGSGPAPRTTPRQPVRRAETGRAVVGRRSDLRIGFALGSDRMTGDGVAKARVFAAALVRPELRDRRFRIEGHTDSSGDAARNRLLSQRRAEAVAAFLVGQGVSRGRLEVRGLGSDAPISGRAAADPLNRRVEAELIS